MMLASPLVASLVCGRERLLIYNDAAARLYGDRHPAALGRPLPETFPEGWATVAPFYERAFAGEAVQVVGQPLDMHGEGSATGIFDALLTPVRDGDGRVASVSMTGHEVGERLRAETALRESEARHRLLIGSWAQAEWEADADGIVIADSPSWRAYTGQTLEQWLGYGWLHAIHPDDRAYAEQQWREAIAVQGRVNAEFRLRAPNGEWRWTNVLAAPVLDPEGTTRKWTGLNIDIDVRRRTEAALRESEELRRIALTGGRMGTWRWDLSAKLIWGDAAFLDLWGFPPSAEPRSLDDFTARMSSQGQAEIGELMTRAIAAGEEFDGQLAVVGGPTSGCWVRWRGLAEAKRPWIVNGVSFDVTAQRLADEQLRVSEDRYRAILESARDYAIFTTDAENLIETWPPGAEAVFGWTAEEAVGQPAGITFLPEDRAAGVPETEMEEARDKGRAPNVRWHLRKDGKRVFIEGATRPLRGEGQEPRGYLKVGQDVTERRKWDERQKVLVAELQHRTRNLMAVVRSIADSSLKRSTDLSDFRARFGDRIGALARVQGLLSRLEEWDRVTFDELIQSELAALGGEAERIVLDGPRGVALRSSTVQTLALAIHELATNAVKYGALGRPQGRLSVTWRLLRAEKGRRPQLHVDWRETGVRMPVEADGLRDSGSGRELIERALPYQLGARTTFVMEPDGVHCTIALPVSERQDGMEKLDE